MIGILALQGAFIEHALMLERLNCDYVFIRNLQDLTNYKINGLIIPGGESTTISKLLVDLNMKDYINKQIDDGLPVFGTCAGLILLAKTIVSDNDNTNCLSIIDIEVKRNAYGRQLGSFCIDENFEGVGQFPMVFIRAPYIEKAYNNVSILATVKNNIVAAKQNNILVTAFHPELTKDARIHQYFIDEMVNRLN